MTSIAIHFRPSTKLGRQRGSLFFRLIHMRKIKTMRTAYRIFPEEWDKEHQHLIFPKEDSERFEALLQIDQALRSDISRLEDIIGQKSIKGSYQVGDIVDEYRFNEKSNLLLIYTKKLMKKLEENQQVRTARAYQTAARGLVQFCGQKTFRSIRSMGICSKTTKAE